MPAFTHRSRFVELRGAVGVEAGGADRDVDVRLLGGAHVGQEGVGRVLDLRSSLALLIAPDQPPKAANGAWLTPSIALGQVVASQVDQLAGGAVDHLLGARDDHGADLVLHLGGLGVDRQRADVAPVERQGAAAAW